MNVLETFATRVDEAMNVKRVFGEPFAKDGVTIIPTARMMGGYGGGEGTPATTESGDKTSAGAGGGSFVRAIASGVFVIKGDKVRWLPAVDVNRMLFGMQVVVVVALVVARSIVRIRASSHTVAPAS
jgi:uncharacterized spore protein YtfJ